MKNRLSLVLTCAFLTVGSLLAGCDFNAAKEAFEEFDIIIQIEPINTNVSVRFVDPQTGEFLNEPVTMTFLGQNGGDVVDTYSDPMTAAQVMGGIGAFGIRNSLVPTESSPAQVRVLGSAPGFETGAATVNIVRVGLTEMTVHMVRSNQTVQGGATASGAGATSGGSVSQTIQATTFSGATSNQTTAGVTIPSGTTATTSSGQAASGILSTSVSFYSVPNAQTSGAFPGGFQPTVQSGSGTQTRQAMTTAGFASFTVTDGSGNRVTQFSPAIQLAIEVPPTTMNQQAGRLVQNGDQIQVFSFSPGQGVWIDEGLTTLSGPGPNGNYKAGFSTTHLSTWNVGYSSNGCSSGVFNVNRNGLNGPLPVVFRASDNSWASSQNTLLAGANTIQITNAPSNLAGYVVEFPTVGASFSGNGSICGASQTLDLPAPSSNLIDVTFTLDFGASCPALRITSIGTYTINYRREGEAAALSRTIHVTDSNFTRDNLQRITGGSLVIPGLLQGSTYVFSTTFDNSVTTRNKTITGSTMVLDISGDLKGDICASN